MNNYKVIENLAQELIQISKIKNLKRPFTEDHLNKIINKYKQNKELYQINLKDLPLSYKLEFNKEGYNLLNQILYQVKQRYGLDFLNKKYNVNFYSLQNLINNKQKSITVKKILDFTNFLNEKLQIKVNILELEKTIVSLVGSKDKKLKVNGLPIKLNNKKWAIILGSILDSWPKKFNILIEDKNFQDDLNNGLKKLGVEPSYIKEQNNIKIKL